VNDTPSIRAEIERILSIAAVVEDALAGAHPPAAP
jgi:hypothetical protein